MPPHTTRTLHTSKRFVIRAFWFIRALGESCAILGGQQWGRFYPLDYAANPTNVSVQRSSVPCP
jgi:hypothetical protein